MPLNTNFQKNIQGSENLSSVNLNPLTESMKSSLRKGFRIPESKPIDAILFGKSMAVSQLVFNLHQSVVQSEKFPNFSNANESISYTPLPDVFSSGYLTLAKNKDRFYSVTTVNNESVMIQFDSPVRGTNAFDAVIYYSALLGTVPLEALKKVMNEKKQLTVIKNVIVNDKDLGFHEDIQVFTLNWQDDCLILAKEVKLGFNDRKKELSNIVADSSEIFFILEKLG
jgi:hypothetical protein